MSDDLVHLFNAYLWVGELDKSFELIELFIEKYRNSIDAKYILVGFDILLENAAEAVSQVPIKRITTTTSLDDGWMTLSISDTGGGIPTAIRDNLLRERISGNGKGLGIGLLKAQTIIEYYGGKIELASTSESGTTMMIRLPQER